MERLASYLSEWLEQHVTGSGGRGAVLGLSGGIDSAVVAALCKRAFPHHTLGLVLPCDSDPARRRRRPAGGHATSASPRAPSTSRATFAMFSRELHESCSEVPADDRLTVANIKPRLRMTTLYAFANHLGYRVIGTGNASELAIGYFTKYGDGGVDLLPLGSLTKTAVRELARHLDVPRASSTSRRRPASGAARPTRARWASPTRSSTPTSRASAGPTPRPSPRSIAASAPQARAAAARAAAGRRVALPAVDAIAATAPREALPAVAAALPRVALPAAIPVHSQAPDPWRSWRLTIVVQKYGGTPSPAPSAS